MSWTHEDILDLIKEYKENTILWDSKHPKYKDKIKRFQALTDVAKSLEKEPGEVERKWIVLMAQYRRERTKIRNGTYNEAKGWFAYDSLAFLSDKFDINKAKYEQRIKKQKRRLQEMSESDHDEEEEEEEEDTKPDIRFIRMPEINLPSSSSSSTLSNGNITRYGVSNMDYDESKCTRNNNESEFDIFGKSVAAQLNNMPFADAMRLQLSIQTLITEHRLSLQNSRSRTRHDE